MPYSYVSVLITTRNRPQELRITLAELAQQDFPKQCFELIVLDDFSDRSLEPLVKECWPTARFVRGETNLDMCVRRNQAFQMATGKYCIQLDDDASFTAHSQLRRAVEIMEECPEAGVLAFYPFNSPDPPPVGFAPEAHRHFVTSFMGAGVLFRKAALDLSGGFSEYFGNHYEEQELCIRIMKAGFGVLFSPEIVIHHRISPINRRATRTWMRGLRNQMWTMVLHMPARRLPLELGWKLLMGCRDAVMHLRPHRLAQSLILFFWGLPNVIRRRQPMSDATLQLYDALRFAQVNSTADFHNPPSCSWSQRFSWLRNVWMNRPRSRAFWDRRRGDLGRSPVAGYAHDFKDK